MDLMITNATGFRTASAIGTRSVLSLGIGPQAFAGPRSNGIVYNGASVVHSLQYGTGLLDPDPIYQATAFTTTPTELLTADPASPERCTIHADGSQSAGYGRAFWDFSTKTLTLTQRVGDALVSNCPRMQLYTASIPSQVGYFKFNLDFELGTPETPWPLLNGEDNVLIWQFNPDIGAVPPLSLQVRAPTNGLQGYRNLCFLRRSDNYSSQVPGSANDGLIGDGTGESYVWIAENVQVLGRHRVEIDLRPDWLGVEVGGEAYLAIRYQGTKQTLHPHSGGGTEYRGYNIYPVTAASTGNYIYLPMIGIYRTTYTNQDPADSCCIKFHVAEILQSMTQPV